MKTAAEVLKIQREWTPDQAFPENYDDTFLRNAIPEAPGMFVDGRIPFGVWSHSAPPGAYKSAIAYQFAVAVTQGRPLPGLEWEFAQRGDVLIISPDETADEQRNRSWGVRPAGSLDSDTGDPGTLAAHDDAQIHYRQPMGATMDERIAWLFMTIRDLEAHYDRKIVMITWDTAGHLIGTSDSKNAYDHVNESLRALNHRLATEQRVMLMTRHIGKDGTSIGTVAINANCNLNTVTKMQADMRSGTLEVDGKARGVAHWSVAVEFDQGLGQHFTDANPMVVGRSKPGSQTRTVLEQLATGPATVAELEQLTKLTNRQVWRTIVRCRTAGEVEVKPGGMWQLTGHGEVAGPPAGAPVRWEENGKTFGTCEGCNRRMLVIEAGQTTHPACEPEPAPRWPSGRPGHEACDLDRTCTGGPYKCLQEPEPVVEDGYEDDVYADAIAEKQEQFKAIQSLTSSIESSRKHPVRFIRRADREAGPWPHITERMSGEHRFRADVPVDATVKVLDRRGSYPSAMSNVPVSANLLTRTGALSVLDKTRAGIYLIPAFTWDDARIGHPLGKIADQDDSQWWVTTPHMRLLARLADQGHIDRPEILDSWTGLAATNLFEQFYVDVREARRATVDDPAARAEVKRMSSVAIRLLWPKADNSRSPFWRPDWHKSVQAEASVRHWAVAWRALQTDPALVLAGMRNVDEVSFVVPDGAPIGSWTPAGYKVGENYGDVSVKNLLTSEEWNGARR